MRKIKYNFRRSIYKVSSFPNLLSNRYVSVSDKERTDTKEVIIGLVTQLDLLSYIMEYEKKHKTAAGESGDGAK